jgi:phosphoadenosine phosphosulfate reductase
VTAVARLLEGLEEADAEEVLRWTYANHRRVALVSSFQAESSVLIDLACRVTERPEVITLDTGRLPEETHRVMDAIRARYPIRLHVRSPDPGQVAALVDVHGTNLFRTSVELRLACCEVRKGLPLARALEGFDAWITGTRREQAATRRQTAVVSHDAAHGGMVKVAPLAGWSREQVWDYVGSHQLPVNRLYERRYTSIGCEPCTRATAPGEDERAGRWSWERDTAKECGLHWAPEAGR